MSRTRWCIVAAAAVAAGCQNKQANSADVVKMPVTVKATDRTIKFKGAGGMDLEGSLMVPAGEMKGRHPAVLLISGSGPTDRDGNQPGLQVDTLKQFARALAAANIVSFRFDKRAVAQYRQKWPTDPAKLSAYFSWDNHLGDALGAWKAMVADDAVDPEHCAILGHSEGGIIALCVAPAAKPQALVLAGTPARPLDVLVREQLSKQAAKMGAEGKTFLAENERLSKTVRSTGKVPADVPLLLKSLYNPSIGLYYQQICRVNPKSMAMQFPGPVLVMNGANDVQVSPEKDAKALYADLKQKENSQIVIVPLASHNFKPVSSDSEAGFEGAVVPDALEAVLRFLTGRIGGKMPQGEITVD